MEIKDYLYILEIVCSISFITSVLFQQRGNALGSAFGGAGTTYSNQRGMQKNLYIASIVFGTILIVNAIIINYI